MFYCVSGVGWFFLLLGCCSKSAELIKWAVVNLTRIHFCSRFLVNDNTSPPSLSPTDTPKKFTNKNKIKTSLKPTPPKQEQQLTKLNNTHTHTRTHIHTHARTRTHAHARTNTRTHTHTHTYASTHTRTNQGLESRCLFLAWGKLHWLPVKQSIDHN